MIVRPMRRIRSFVRRDGRLTEAQKNALENVLPVFQLHLQDGLIDPAKVFKRHAKTTVEIGFGAGNSLLEMAKSNPDENFIGIETYLPGMGSLLQEIALLDLKNIRVYYEDAVEVFEHCIQNMSLDVVQIFFPDPWPKRKHHKRRFVQENIVKLIFSKLKLNGTIHLATDWEDYAKHMMKVLSSFPSFKNVMGVGNYADRSIKRPVVTKFEQRGQQSGRAIWELQFVKVLA